MAGLSLATRDASRVLVIHRKSWPARHPGVILVFCILFIIGGGLLSLYLYRKWMARKAARRTITA
jgi:hypothetical protein